ncbi:sugar isomerase [Holdemanella biformis]|uniref:Sugar isomerase n=1 Tax=Holdemanella biformis TaxID=1735 RepID=A0A413CX94_9FIRM|nr:polysaccharide biosynthesis C-terminal domain-containing protein [Holdemanella biformis]RGW76133.1 sugar isomerase [Holdemanella biformis]
MRKKKLFLNTFFSWIYQVLAIVSSLILPRIYLAFYGSEMNGLVQSITQFLSIISFMQLGMGAVVQASLYKPLVNGENKEISKIIASANKFFKKIGLILIVYSIVLIFVYPQFTNNVFQYQDVMFLILAISLNLFAQYYFGLVDILLLVADQKGYIDYCGSIISLIVNTVVCITLIYAGYSIVNVKIISSVILLIKPIFNRIYVNKHYSINRNIKYEGEPIKQKWNGIAQHISAVVLDNTDTIVLTMFSTLSNVSIYGIYHMVIFGVKTLLSSISNGIEAMLGEIWARNNKQELLDCFSWVEWVVHNFVILIFGCTGTLIVPFVLIYTKGITDANYCQYEFAILIVLAHALHSIRLPYHMMIKASGQFKETQSNYFVSAGINLLVSIVTVKYMGLVGVAIGTLVAMVYQTLWVAIYNYKKLVVRKMKELLKLTLVDCLCIFLSVLIVIKLPIFSDTFIKWLLSAGIVFAIWFFIIFTINYIFYKNKVKFLINKMKARIKK